MTNDKVKTETGVKQEERKFTIETLRKDCVKLFDCTTSTFDGAFYGKEVREYTIAEAKSIVSSWLNKEVR